MSTENQSRTRSTTQWTAFFSIAIVGMLFVIGMSLPQTSEASVVTLKPLMFISPIGNPVLSIAKTVDNGTPQPGDIVNYTLSYANTALGSQAFNVRVYDFLPAGVQYLSASPAPASESGGTLLFTAPSVGPDTVPLNITVQVRVLSGHAALLNQALVTADGVTPTTDSLLITTTPATEHLRLTKDGDAATLIGEELEYTLSCENVGPVTYNNVEVLDVLPAGVTMISATQPPALTMPPLLKWAVGTLAPGARWSVTLMTTTPSDVGVITNTALLQAPTHVSLQALWATQVISEGVILKVDKVGSAEEVYPGDPLIYTLTYRNKGTAPATDVVITDTLPTDIGASNATPAPTSTNGQQWVWTIPALDVSATGNIVITTTVEITTQGTLHNNVAISAPGAWGDTDDFYTLIKWRTIYLPLVLRAYKP